MKTHLLICVFIGLQLAACRKDSGNNPVSTDYIIFGSDDNLKIVAVDTIFSGSYNQPVEAKLDVDGDQIPDISFSSVIWGSPAVGQHPRCSVYSLNTNMGLQGYLLTDTSFVHFTQSIDSSNAPLINVYKNYYYTCSRMDGTDSILSLTLGHFTLQAKLKNSVLYKTDVFRADSSVVCSDAYALPTSPTTSNDTTYYNYSTYDNNCDLFPQNQICYLGFKKNVSGVDKLGWVKFSISNKYIVSILETAIQK